MNFWGTLFYFSGFITIITVVLVAIDPQELMIPTENKKPKKIAIKLPQDTKLPEVAEAPPNQNSQQLPKPEPMTLAVESFKTYQSANSSTGGFSPAEGESTRALLNEIQNQSRPPQVSLRRSPDYPEQAKRQNLEGFVLVRILIGANGELIKTEIVESQPLGVFDRSVLDSIAGWKYTPGLQEGKQVSMWLTQKVRFQLD